MLIHHYYDNKTKELQYVYTSKDGLKFSTDKLSKDDLWNWKCIESPTDQKSYDGKFVKKMHTKSGNLSAFRIYDYLTSKKVFNKIKPDKCFISIDLYGKHIVNSVFIWYKGKGMMLTTNESLETIYNKKIFTTERKIWVALHKFCKEKNAILYTWDSSHYNIIQERLKKYTVYGSRQCLFNYFDIYEQYDKSVTIKNSDDVNEVYEIVTQDTEKKCVNSKTDVYFSELIKLSEIDRELKLHELICSIANIAKIGLTQHHSMIRISEKILYDVYRTKGLVLPQIRKPNIKESTYKGGKTTEPITGLHSNVYYLDYKAMYPSLVVANNISPETYTKKKRDMINVNGVNFTKRKKGVLPLIYVKLLKKRDLLTNPTKYSALKIIMNALYGAFGSEFFYFYNVDIAKSITFLGRDLITRTNRLINAYMLQRYGKEKAVIYNDTDSAFVSAEGIEKMHIEHLLKIINKYAANLYEGNTVVKMTLDKKMDKLLLISKKQYVYISNGKLGITGFTTNHSSTSLYARKNLNDILYRLLDIGFQNEKSIISLLCEKYQLFLLEKLENIAESVKLRTYNPYDDYNDLVVSKKARPQVIGVAVYNHFLHKYNLTKKYKPIKQNDRIKFYRTTNKDIPVMSFKQKIPPQIVQPCDHRKQFEETVLKPLNRSLQGTPYKKITMANIF